MINSSAVALRVVPNAAFFYYFSSFVQGSVRLDASQKVSKEILMKADHAAMLAKKRSTKVSLLYPVSNQQLSVARRALVARHSH